ncbi:hypothetical protein V8E36_008904 [Tilletia maclaganii]
MNGNAVNGSYKGEQRLRQLADVITSSISTIEKEHSERHLAPLTIDEAAPHSTDDPAVERLPSIAERKARDQILCAVSELSAIVDHPVSRLAKISSAYLDVSVLNFAAENGIPDIIEANATRPDGALSAVDIAKHVGTDATRTTRLLRYLTAIHVFTETEEGYFANNRYSIHFKKGSPLEAVFGMGVYDVGPPALRITEFMRTKYAYEQDATGHLPLNLNFDYPGKSMFAWMNEPFNADRLERFNRTMVMKSHDSYAIVADLPWDELLPQGGKLVDVGGGVGSLACSIQKARPDIKVFVQDQAGMIEQAKSFWAKANPEAIQDGSTQLQVHDFFQKNPVDGGDLYAFRAIYSNWDDKSSASILKAALASAGPKSRILVIDSILLPALHTGDAPSSVNELRSDTQQDLTMMTLFPSLERTRSDWDRLLASVGLEVKQVFAVRSRKTCFEVGRV